MRNPLQGAALSYAERGMHVIPLHTVVRGVCSCGRGCSQPGKHPRTGHGLNDSTTDPEIITSWWERWPDANIGVRTGEVSGIWVVDLDGKRSVDIGDGVLIPEGEHSLSTLEQTARSRLPDTLTAITGGGGRHLVYTYPNDGDSHGNRANLVPSVDIRGDGGYIVAPPSVHASGGTYRWIDETEPVTSAPTWFVNTASRASGSTEAFEERETVGEGERNDYLYRYACKLRGEGHGGGDLGELVQLHNLMVNKPPLPVNEVLALVTSAMTHQPNEAAEFQFDEPNTTAPIPEGADIAISIGDLFRNPPQLPEPIIEGGVLDVGDGFILGGQPGSGKSWLSLDMAIAVASGTPWVGQFPTRQGPVLFVDKESNIANLFDRIGQLLKGRNQEHNDMPLHLKVSEQINLDTPVGFAILSRMLHRYRPSLVIFDALVRFHTGNENSTQDIARFFESSRQLQAHYGTAFLFIHHIRKPMKDNNDDDLVNTLRGSSDIIGWPDSIFLAMDQGDNYRLVHGKSRNHEKLDPFEVGHVISDGVAKLGYRDPTSIPRPHGTEATRSAIVNTVATLSMNGYATLEKIAGFTQLSTTTTQDHLDVLGAEGRVSRFHTGLERAWMVPGKTFYTQERF